MLGGLTIYLRVANFLQCIRAKNYENWLAVDKVIAKIIRLTFFWPTLYIQSRHAARVIGMRQLKFYGGTGEPSPHGLLCLLPISFKILPCKRLVISAVTRSATMFRQFGTLYQLTWLILLTSRFYLVLNVASKRISTNFHSRPSYERCPRLGFISLNWHMAHYQLHDWLTDRLMTLTKKTQEATNRTVGANIEHCVATTRYQYLESLFGSKSSDHAAPDPNDSSKPSYQHMFVQNFVQKSQWTDLPAFFKRFETELV